MKFVVTTKTGDDGFTQVSASGRVSKASTEVECMGSIDELQVALGTIQVDDTEIQEVLKKIQKEIFEIGSLLYAKKDPQVLIDGIERIENWQEDFLKKHPIDYDWHLTTKETMFVDEARVRTRRCERLVVRLIEQEQAKTQEMYVAQKYLNRLSDLLWVVARIVKQKPYHRRQQKKQQEKLSSLFDEQQQL